MGRHLALAATMAAASAGAQEPAPSAATEDTFSSAILDQGEQLKILKGLTEYDRAGPLTGRLVSVGSGGATILVNRWIDDFAPLHPDAVFNAQGAGSTAGLAALGRGDADLVPMSRALTPMERDSLTTVLGHPPVQVVVAMDALGVYVNLHNPIEQLSFAQLDRIFSRAPRGGLGADTWGDLGSPAPFATHAIVRYSLDTMHSIYAIVRDTVLGGADYRFDVRFERVPRGMVQSVGADDGGIAFASIIFATQRTRLVPLVAGDGTAYAPSYDNVLSGRYPLARPIYIVVNKAPGQPLKPLVLEFLRFVTSRRGQQIAAFGGNYPISPPLQQAARKQIE